MPSPQIIATLVKEAMKTGKFTIGAREVISGMKGAKAVICLNSLPPKLNERVRNEAKKHGVPVIDLSMSTSEFSRLLGRPFRISAFSLKSVGEAELEQLVSQ